MTYESDRKLIMKKEQELLKKELYYKNKIDELLEKGMGYSLYYKQLDDLRKEARKERMLFSTRNAGFAL